MKYNIWAYRHQKVPLIDEVFMKYLASLTGNALIYRLIQNPAACRGLTPVSNSAARSRFPLPPPSGVRRRKEKKSKTRGLR